MTFEELPEFEKDLKALQKKYRTLPEDLLVLKQILSVLPHERPPFSYLISDLGINTRVIKIKKIACRSLKGKGVNSGLRMVYAYFPEFHKIIFIELFHKNQQELESRERIFRYFG